MNLFSQWGLQCAGPCGELTLGDTHTWGSVTAESRDKTCSKDPMENGGFKEFGGSKSHLWARGLEGLQSMGGHGYPRSLTRLSFFFSEEAEKTMEEGDFARPAGGGVS